MTKRSKKYKIKRKYKGSKDKRATFYTNKTPTADGRKPDKRTCLYYDSSTQKCMNERCSTSYCMTSHNCTMYSRKVKNNQKEHNNQLSDYDDDYIELPYQATTHQNDYRYIALSKSIGMPVNVQYLKKADNDARRHKTRCIHYYYNTKNCSIKGKQCAGSSRCDNYKEKKDRSERRYELVKGD